MTRSIIPRRSIEIATESVGAFRGLVIQGARQVGKSTMAGLLAEKLKCPTVTLDDEATLLSATDDPGLFLRQLGKPAVIDEVQRGGDPLVLALKKELDTNPIPGRYVMTGSTNFLTSPALTESLAGRVDLLTLWPLSRGELASSSEDLIDRLFIEGPHALLDKTENGPTRRDYLELVCAGGYPEAIRLAGRPRQRWFERYLETVLRREVETAADLRRFDRLLAMARLLLSRTGSEYIPSRLAEDLSMDRATVETYQPWLESAFLVHRLPPWSRNITKRVTGKAKLHACDTGLAAAIAGQTPSGLDRRGETLAGPLVESFVTGELAKQLTYCQTSGRLHHYRDQRQNEIDLVIETSDGKILAIEVKASTVARPSDAATIAQLRDKLDTVGSDFAGGIVFHTGTDRTRLGERIVGLPIADIWT